MNMKEGYDKNLTWVNMYILIRKTIGEIMILIDKTISKIVILYICKNNENTSAKKETRIREFLFGWSSRGCVLWSSYGTNRDS